MSKLKSAFSAILIISSLYVVFKYTNAAEVLAQTAPDFTQQVTTKYNDFLRFNQNIKAQSPDYSKYLTNLSTLNTKELSTLEDSYKKVTIDENTSLNDLPQAQAVKTLDLSIIRYENLNQSLYSILEKIRTSANAVNDSGFATNNIDEELDGLTQHITKIESYLSTLNYVSDQMNQQKVSLNDGMNKASDLIGDINDEYTILFGQVKELIKNNVQ